MPLTALSSSNGGLVVSWSFPASIETVWSALTDPVSQERWLGTPIESDLRTGGRLIVDHGDGYLCSSDLTLFEPPHRLAMTWEFPDEPRSQVAVALRESDACATRADLTHLGLGDLAPSYEPGWATHLTYLEAVTRGDTIAPSQFWSLHATFATLLRPDRSSVTDRSSDHL